MVDQVRFPPSIGGSGKTYTNDANPQTGVFNGGHRTNFFPMLADTVAAAGYVSQYAQAIDGAKGNADRAEDARGYVEGYAGALKNNILDYYRQKATLDLDFERGLYRVDDGTLMETTDASEILTVTRSTPKWVEGPHGLLREVPAHTAARKWCLGEPLGLVTNNALTNKILQSNLLSSSEWYSQNVSLSVSDVLFSHDGRMLNKITQNTGSGVHLVQQSFSDSYDNHWVSFLAKAGETTRLRVRTTTASTQGVTIDLLNGDVLAQGEGVSFTSVTPFQNGIYRVVFRVNLTNRMLFYPENANGDINYTGDGVSSLYVGAVSVSRRRPLEYVETNESEASSQGDFPVLNLGSDNFNPSNFTWYFEYINYNTSDDSFSICGSIGISGFNVLASFTPGATPRFDLRNLEGGDWLPISGYVVDNEHGKKQKIAVTYSQNDRTARLFWNGQLRAEQPEVNGFSSVGGLILGSRDPSVAGFESETSFIDFFSLPFAVTQLEAEELTAL